MVIADRISEPVWERFEREGYVRLGRVMDDQRLAAMRLRIDDIMLGAPSVDYERVRMQLDVDPQRDGNPGPMSVGHKGATLNYRKIEQLEYDPTFLAYMKQPLLRHICARVYGPDTAVGCFRAMFMNKPAHEGTHLQWHQDRWTDLDRDPEVTVWATLDDSTVANGCLKIIPRSHHTLLNPESGAGFLSPQQVEEVDATQVPHYLEMKAGEGVLLHNWTLHSSEVNTTDIPRRAFSVCFLDARTISASGRMWPVIFGQGELMLAAEEV